MPMNPKLKLTIVIGTRPEAIKLAPVARAAMDRPELAVTVCSTGQHAHMVNSVLGQFGITPDVDLQVMKPRQSLTELTCSLLTLLEDRFTLDRPDWVIVQGDTTTAFTAALAAFYQKIDVAHVEAGLRTSNIYAPWPEEMNRRLISGIARLHFPPMPSNGDNLRREGIPDSSIVTTGNTGIDALKWLVGQLSRDDALHAQAQKTLDGSGLACLKAQSTAPLVLITGHRRESFGAGFVSICQAISSLAERYPDHHFIYPVHPNPAVRDTVYKELGDGRLSNIHLIDPLDYLPFVLLMSRAQVIITDSGGVQEEAPSLGKRVVVMRDVTERSEGIETGLIRLTGTDRDRIISNVSDALSGLWASNPQGADVYGDGKASQRILDALMSQPRRQT